MRGKVVLLPFPFDDLSSAKVRPAICLTDPISRHGHIVVAFVSSVVPSPLLATDLLLDPGSLDFRQTGLRVRSVVRLHRLATVTSALIQRDLGDLSIRQLHEASQRLITLLTV
jgi:mRNA interferase MazF